MLDLTIASALFLVLAPVFVAALGGIAIDMLVAPRDRGSFFYRETRISRGRPFDLLKFRTLRTDVLVEMQRGGGHARLFEAELGNLTLAGRQLKRWYLDEIPQLLNVLRGDMSLVGPRPWPPAMVERQVAEGQDYRNRIVAGLTGPAQVTKGDSSARYADLDLQYARQCLTLRGGALVRVDVGILRRTVGVIVRRKGLSY